MRKFLMSSLLGLAGVSGAAAQDVEYTTESLDSIRQQVENGEAVLLDVREVDEWNQGYIRQALLVATSEFRDADTITEAIGKLSKEKPIFCHCKKGGRAMMISGMLAKQGFDIRPMKQSYKQIVASGFDEVMPPDTKN